MSLFGNIDLVSGCKPIIVKHNIVAVNHYLIKSLTYCTLEQHVTISNLACHNFSFDCRSNDDSNVYLINDVQDPLQVSV